MSLGRESVCSPTQAKALEWATRVFVWWAERSILLPVLTMLFGGEQLLQLFLEFAYVLEVAVDAGKADIGDGIEGLQAVHQQLADFAGGALALGRVHEEVFGLVDQRFHIAGGDGAFFAGVQQAAEDFLALEFLAASVFFHHHVGDFVDALIGGEALVAALAFAAAANGLGFFTLARINYAVLRKPAVWAFHCFVLIIGHGAQGPAARDQGPAARDQGPGNRQ